MDDTTPARWITASLARLDETNALPWTDATSERTEPMIRLDRNHDLSPYDPAPEGKAKILLKVVNETAGPDLWPVPPEGYWQNPAGAPFGRVADLRSLQDPFVAQWVSENQRPGTLILVSFAYGMEAGQVEDAPVLETLVDSTPDSPEETAIREAARAEHYDRTGLRPPETWGGKPIERNFPYYMPGEETAR